ncbi:DUF418 domain-containing protein [Phocicoccus pinnipedialis]|uniref:DUF418 domain-containing protein n=1 Tax=Phocicoccus pinnipedialis TaxID=110845 RepID=A0A6V7RDF2_9BACL|nr:DUF418 domain-containing protein [Jeotgalicoccus pinnipedialis]MBP1939525.1 uncharacterized protein [Jeotgalicoccus pinnipedialis]CAD2075026.1 hypothetical protein JEOPIN946_00914 [Jeotgalicoccus pinnipedialis]
MTHQPTMLNERIHELDSIRGVALLGILLMNIMSFAGAYLDIAVTFSLPEMFQGNANQLTLFLVNTFVTTNFYTLFSILFGLGFFIFLKRAKDKTNQPNLLFSRRMVGLLIIGLIHAILIWYGDILVAYALIGFVLILFFKVPPAWNLGIAIAISVVTTGIMLILHTIMYYMRGHENLFFNPKYIQPTGIEEVATNGNYIDMILFNAEYTLDMFVGLVFMLPLILMMFLIGLYIGQKEYHKKIGEIRPLLYKISIITLVLGLPIKALTAYIQSYRADDIGFSVLAGISSTIGGPLMATFYLSTLALLFNSFKGLNKIFAPVGRMALTNYIIQSVVMLILFYGFGFFGKIDMMYLPFIAVLFFALQVIYSHWFMKRYPFGPLEYVWRRFTYKSKISIRHN